MMQTPPGCACTGDCDVNLKAINADMSIVTDADLTWLYPIDADLSVVTDADTKWLCPLNADLSTVTDADTTWLCPCLCL